MARYGWFGLMDRMRANNDFAGIEQPSFDLQIGQDAPVEATEKTLQDAMSTTALANCDVIVTCQGGDYTKAVYGPLRDSGWKGYWIDAASASDGIGQCDCIGSCESRCDRSGARQWPRILLAVIVLSV